MGDLDIWYAIAAETLAEGKEALSAFLAQKGVPLEDINRQLITLEEVVEQTPRRDGWYFMRTNWPGAKGPFATRGAAELAAEEHGMEYRP